MSVVKFGAFSFLRIDLSAERARILRHLEKMVDAENWDEVVSSAEKLKEASRVPSWVYVLEEEDGDRVKIGFTAEADPIRRIWTHLRSSSSGRVLRIVFILPAEVGVETRLHQRFAEHLVPTKTEWFFRRGAVEDMVLSGAVTLASEFGCAFVLVPHHDAIEDDESSELEEPVGPVEIALANTLETIAHRMRLELATPNEERQMLAAKRQVERTLALYQRTRPAVLSIPAPSEGLQ